MTRCAAGFAAFIACAGAASADLPKQLDVRAKSVAYYPERSLVAADGRVRVVAGERTIEADAVRYDLAANRLLATGNVHVRGATSSLSAVAYALDLAGDNVTLLEENPLPTISRLHGDDRAQPAAGSLAPDAFAAADLDGLRPYIRSTHAVITPNVNVRMTPAEFPTSTRLALPSPSYLYTFGTNQAFQTTALPSASFDQPYGLFGNSHSLLAMHFRYDARGGAGIAFDHHIAFNPQSYLVSSFVPAHDSRFDLVGFQQIHPGLSQSISATMQPGAAYANYTLLHIDSKFATSLRLTQSNGHSGEEVGLSTRDHMLARVLDYTLSAAFGFDHDDGLQIAPGQSHTTLGANLLTPTFRGPFHSDLGLQYQISSTSYNVGHRSASSTLTGTVSRELKRNLSLYSSASFGQFVDAYRFDAARYLGLPDPSSPYFTPDGTLFPGYFAYAGVGTERTYFAKLTFSPSPAFNLGVSLTHANDFPQYHGYGRPPLWASFELRLHPIRNVGIVFGKSYQFGWNGLRFTPSYTFAITP